MVEYTIILDGVPHVFTSITKAARFYMQAVVDDAHTEMYVCNSEIKVKAIAMLMD